MPQKRHTSFPECWQSPHGQGTAYGWSCSHRGKVSHPSHWPEPPEPEAGCPELGHCSHHSSACAAHRCQGCSPRSWVSLSGRCWCHHPCAEYLARGQGKKRCCSECAGWLKGELKVTFRVKLFSIRDESTIQIHTTFQMLSYFVRFWGRNILYLFVSLPQLYYGRLPTSSSSKPWSHPNIDVIVVFFFLPSW